MNVPSDQPSEPADTSPASKQPASNPAALAVGATPAAEDHVSEVDADTVIPPEPPTLEETVKTLLVGKPLNLADKSVYQHISLVAFLAWVGLGADGLSSSCYGPSEAFEFLGSYSYLAVFLALATVFTVFVISTCYSYIIEAFPSGGGGYLVASKMLGREIGALSGSALVIDYVLTVTVSIAAAGDALFGLIGLTGDQYDTFRLYCETGAIIFLVILNLRGAKESITILMPIFMIFLITHAIMIAGLLGIHVTEFPELVSDVATSMQRDAAAPPRNPGDLYGWPLLILVLLKAYSLGAGTYTGIEAVSNSMAVMREPRVATGQRTMIYMAVSLAITAGGLMLAYLLFELDLKHHGTTLYQLKHETKQTMNDLLTQWFVMGSDALLSGKSAGWFGGAFRYVTIISEATLLLVAAQAGFIGGPKCLANMAHDSWVPHWFGSLSERLASHNGILLIGAAAIGALWANNGEVHVLIILYSINVFVTFTLSMLGMTLFYRQLSKKRSGMGWKIALFVFGTIVCSSILAVTVIFKFMDGAWKTVVVTGMLTGLCLLVNRYYRDISRRVRALDESLGTIEIQGTPTTAQPKPDAPTAVVLVGGYSGLGVHTLLNALRFMPQHFKNVMFISVGVVDSGNFKGAEAMEDLRQHTEKSLEKYVDLARKLGFASRGYMAFGADVVDELEQLCRVVHRDYPQAVVFAGQLVFQRETWYGALLHNQTAFSLQRRLQWDGVPMVILPTRVREG